MTTHTHGSQHGNPAPADGWQAQQWAQQITPEGQAQQAQLQAQIDALRAQMEAAKGHGR